MSLNQRISNRKILTNLKILVFGSSGVGKTSILKRLVNKKFEPVPITICPDLETTTVFYQDSPIKLTIWDTAGQERFNALPSNLFRDVHGAVLVYDVTNRQTFIDLHKWMESFQGYFAGAEHLPVIIILGNKIDVDSTEVTRQEGAQYARRHRTLFLETSAREGHGVQQAFEDLVHKIIETPGLWRRGDDLDEQIVRLNRNDRDDKPAGVLTVCGQC